MGKERLEWNGCKWEAGQKEDPKEKDDEGRSREAARGIRANSAGRDRAHPPDKEGHAQHGQVRNAGRSPAGFLDTRLGGVCEHPPGRRRQER